MEENKYNNYIKWCLPDFNNIKDEKNNIPYIIQLILERRGFNTLEKQFKYLNNTDLGDPTLEFPYLNKALNILEKFCLENQSIAICGDYDADGMTSTALLVEALSNLGGNPIPFIPSRKSEGYGLNENMINSINDQKIKLIITVDNGVTAISSLKLAKKFNIDIILTDHHKIPDVIPKVFALIHPSTLPEDSDYKQLAGVGLAYILATSLAKKMHRYDSIVSSLDLFCIGTIADMAIISGANRILLKNGIKQLYNTNNIGLKSIYSKLKFPENEINTRVIGFKLAPIINAIGRLSEPNIIIKLLTSKDISEVDNLSDLCITINNERKELTNKYTDEAFSMLNSKNENIPSFILLYNSNWNSGIIGIVAARVMDRYKRPTVIIGSGSNNKLTGSARAPKGFNLIKAFEKCSDLFESFGGHESAAGFKIKSNNITILDCKLNNIALKWIENKKYLFELKPDIHIRLNEVNMQLWNDLKSLEPFGIGNPQPLFWSRGCNVINSYKINKKHLILTLEQNNFRIKAVMWNTDRYIKKDQNLDIVFKIELDNWNKNSEFQLEIQDFKYYSEIIYLKVNSKIYQCSLTSDNKIKICNEYGQYIYSNCILTDKPISSSNKYSLYKKELIEKASVAMGLMH